jgi:hypothetical protein
MPFVFPGVSRKQKDYISSSYICLTNTLYLDFLQSHYAIPKLAVCN